MKKFKPGGFGGIFGPPKGPAVLSPVFAPRPVVSAGLGSDRASYWVGGTGNTSDAANHWAATSGGIAAAAYAPDAGTHVIFDANSGSGAFTITVDATLNCRDFNMLNCGGTPTLAGASSITCAGNWSLPSSLVRTFSGTVTFSSAQPNTITMSGIAFANTFAFQNSAGGSGSWLLKDALNVGATTGNITLTSGSLDTNGMTVTCATFQCTSGTFTLTCGASTFNVLAWNIAAGTTISAASASIIMATAGGFFDGGGKTYGTLSWTITNQANARITGANSFGTLTLIGNANKSNSIGFGNDQTVTGTLKYLGNSAINSLLICACDSGGSVTPGTTRTITAAAIDAASDFVYFMDIAGAGAAAPFATGSRLGDCGGNSGITFTASATQTATGTASFTWSTHGWTSRVPLPQDDVVIPNAFVASQTITVDMPCLGRNLTFSHTGSPTFSHTVGQRVGGTPNVMGSVTLTTLTGNAFGAGLFMGSRGTSSLTSAGVSIAGAMTVQNPGGTFSLNDALSHTGGGISVQLGANGAGTSGTFNDNGFSVSIGSGGASGQFRAITSGGVVNKTGFWTILKLDATDSAGFVTGGGITFNDTGGTLKFQHSATGCGNFQVQHNAAPNVINDLYLAGSGIGSFQIAGASFTATKFRCDQMSAAIRITAGNTLTLGAGAHAFNGQSNNGTDYQFGRLFGTASANFTTPSAAANQITGDIELIAYAALVDWSSASGEQDFIAKRTGSVSTAANYAFCKNLSSGSLALIYWNAAGAALDVKASTVATNFAAGSAHWVRVTRSSATGTITFYTSNDPQSTAPGSVAWTQLGATVTSTAGGLTSTTDAVEVGSINSGASNLVTGYVARATISGTIGGAAAVDFNANTYASGATWVSATGETWTKNGNAIIGATNKISLCSATAASHTLAKSGGGLIDAYFLTVDRSTASPASTFTAHFSTDGGNNSQWTFQAARYWVGGTGNWSSTAQWSTASGGASGASVPDTTMDVEFDGNSNATAYTATVDASASSNDLHFGAAPKTSGTITWAGSQALTINRSFTGLSGMTRSYTGAITFNGTGAYSITSNGVAFSQTIFVANNGGTCTLLDAFNDSGGTIAIRGTNSVFNTNGVSVIGAMSAPTAVSGSGTWTLTLGATTWDLQASQAWNAQGLGTLNVNTSTIIARGTNAFSGGGFTYNIVSWLCDNSGLGRTFTINDANTFGTLNLVGGPRADHFVTLSANQTITGTFKYLGDSEAHPFLIQSSVLGTARTITAAAIDATSNFTHFMDITGAGVGSPFATGTRIGDCGGNSGITFTVSAQQTWQGTVSGSWSNVAKWTSRVPLPQDDVVVNAAFSASQTITVDMARLGRNVTFSCTGSPTISFSGIGTVAISFYGSWTFASGMTATDGASASILTARGRSSFTFTSNGVAFSGNLSFANAAPGGTLALGDAMVISGASGQSYKCQAGTFDLAGFAFTLVSANLNPVPDIARTFTNSGSATTVTFTGNGQVWGVAGTQQTISVANVTFKLTNASALEASFAGAGKTYGNLWLSGSGIGSYQISGANTFNEVKCDKLGSEIRMPAGVTNTLALLTAQGQAAVGGDQVYARCFADATGIFTSSRTAAMVIAGDMTVKVKVAPVAYNVTEFVTGKSSGGTMDWSLFFSSGAITLRINDTTNTLRSYSIAWTAPSAGADKWVKVELDVDNGAAGSTASFFSSDDDVTYTPLTTSTIAAVVAIRDTGSSSTINVGADLNGSSSANPINARIYRTKVYSGLESVGGATLAVDFNPASYSTGTTWVSTTGETWTINGNALINATNRIGVCSTTGSAATLSYTGTNHITVNYGAIRNITASEGVTKWFAANSLNEGGNTGWTFSGFQGTGALAGSLSFVGSEKNQAGKPLTGALSFAGAESRSISHQAAAALSFVGSQSRMSSKGLAGSSSFSGAMSRRAQPQMPANLGLSGAYNTAIAAHLPAATSGLSGAMVKMPRRPLSGGLSFSGNDIIMVGENFLQAAALLSFAGSLSKRAKVLMPSTISFFGIEVFQRNRDLASTLAFKGHVGRFTGSIYNSVTGAVSKFWRAIGPDKTIE